TSSARSALVRDKRLASERGCSALSGVSSTLAGTSRSGSRPACCMSSIRRGEAEASTSLWKTVIDEPAGGRAALLEAVGDAALGEVVGRHLDQDLVTGEHADAVLAHPTRGVGDDFVLVLELDPEHGVGQQFGDDTRKFEDFFLRHSI